MSMSKIFPKEIGVGVDKGVDVAQTQFHKFMEDK